jgi:hypothetical protein
VACKTVAGPLSAEKQHVGCKTVAGPLSAQAGLKNSHVGTWAEGLSRARGAVVPVVPEEEDKALNLAQG